MKTHPRTAQFYHKSPLSVVLNHARRLAYLGDAQKIHDALKYEYGPDQKLPCKAVLTAIVEERRAKFSKARNDVAKRDEARL